MSLLDNILDLIKEDNLYNQIDNSLNIALKNFNYSLTNRITHSEFNAIIKSFYQHLNQYGLTLRGGISEEQVSAEVFWILENHYQGFESKGYNVALIDACNGEFEIVLERLVEIIKATQRDKYINWVLKSKIDPSDYYLKKEIVEEILERYGYILHPEVKKLSSWQLIPHIKDLLLMISTRIFK